MWILGIIGVAVLSLAYGIGMGVHLATFVICMQNDYGDIEHAPRTLKLACLFESLFWPRVFWLHDE